MVSDTMACQLGNGDCRWTMGTSGIPRKSMPPQFRQRMNWKYLLIILEKVIRCHEGDEVAYPCRTLNDGAAANVSFAISLLQVRTSNG